MTQKSKINNSDLFDQFLVDFQEDIKRIVGKIKKRFHALSDEEIYSECNLHLLKNKERILDGFPKDQDFTQAEFKKIAYHYVKNETVWSHYRLVNKSYHKRKVDGFIETDDGTKSYFEAVIETDGQENSEIDNDKLYFGSNSKQFFRMLLKYSYLLTEQELRIISYIQAGLNLTKIADKLHVTHQAISFCFVNIQKKLNQHFNFDEVINGGSVNSIKKGESAINSFFRSKSRRHALDALNKQKMRNFIIDNPNKYTAKQINQKLFDNKFTVRRIWGFIKSLKLNQFVKLEADK